MLTNSMNSFMKAQSQANNEVLCNLLEKKVQIKNEEGVIQVRAKGDPFCLEVELDMKISHISLPDSQTLVVTKFPEVLIRNDRDVRRLKNGDQVQLHIVNDQSK